MTLTKGELQECCLNHYLTKYHSPYILTYKPTIRVRVNSDDEALGVGLYMGHVTQP